MSGIAPLIPLAAADVFQGGNFPSIYGSMIMVGTAIGAFAPWFGGYIFDITGSYDYAFVVAMIAASISCAILWLTAPRKVRLAGGRPVKPG